MPVYRLKEEDRSFFREGVGDLIRGRSPEENTSRALKDIKGSLFTVGDVCTDLVLREGRKPDIIVFDRRTQRTERFDIRFDEDHYHLHTAANPAGQITEEAFEALRSALAERPAAVDIDGEEDLLTAALIHLAEPGDTILYGDPGLDGEEGLRKVNVDQPLQDRTRKVLGLADEDEATP
jgi:uncharacterized protein (UPF0218 family)